MPLSCHIDTLEVSRGSLTRVVSGVELVSYMEGSGDIQNGKQVWGRENDRMQICFLLLHIGLRPMGGRYWKAGFASTKNFNTAFHH